MLFGQCKGRDLWESQLLLPHLIVQAVLCGSVCLLPYAPQSTALRVLAVVALAVHLALSLIDRYGAHPTDNATQGAAFLGRVRLGPLYAWRDGLIIGVALTVLCIWFVPVIAFVPGLLGLAMYEHAYVRAGQLPPLS